MGPWALPWSKSQGGFETLSHLKDNLNNENCNHLALFMQPIMLQFVQKHCDFTNLKSMMSLSCVNNYGNTYVVKVFS